ncbi:MAG: DUF58 domain-containing protein [Magnetospirillum sp.]|nr:DUF58 domain-containing protein [Magnetospirillum sp.]
MKASALQHQAEDLASRLPPLLAAAERLAASVALGAHGRRRTGPGDTFWQYRRAGPGDGAGSIDWRRSGRSDHLFVRETEWAAAQTVWLDLDCSASMDWRSDVALPTKSQRTLLMTLALAALLLRGGERVAPLSGACLPCWGHGALSRLATALVLGGPGEPAPPRDAIIVLAGDFLSPLDRIEARIAALARAGAGGHLLQILDPAEESLPYEGRIRFEGLEGEGDLLARRAEDLRPSYTNRLAAHRDGIASVARRFGWSFATHRTDHSPAPGLLALSQRLARR